MESVSCGTGKETVGYNRPAFGFTPLRYSSPIASSTDQAVMLRTLKLKYEISGPSPCFSDDSSMPSGPTSTCETIFVDQVKGHELRQRTA